MTCQECELRLAGEERDEAVSEHLAGCEACKIFANDLQANLQALHEFAAEAMPALRNAPTRKKQPVWPWVAAAAIAAAILLMISIPLWREQSPRRGTAAARNTESSARTTAAAIQGSGGVASDSATQPMHRVQAAVRKPRRAIPQTEPKILQVKMLTDDPNVVIYWQVETRSNAGSKGTE